MATPTLPISDDTLLSALHWRYATKVFDSQKTIPAEIWKALEETLILTPSSYGLQPWKFIVITDKELRAKLLPHSWNQKQVVDCSHFVIFAAELNVGEAFIDKNIRRIAEVRGSTVESLQGYRNMMVDSLVKGPRSKIINEWAARQCYIALGNFMTAAAVLKIDTCPMEGFESAEFDKILDLKSKNLTSVVCCPAGYRSENDKYAAQPKVRFNAEEVVEHI